MAAGKPTEIAYWLGCMRHVPDVQTIRERWGVSRACAYRWRAFALSGGRSQYGSMNRKTSQRLNEYAHHDH